MSYFRCTGSGGSTPATLITKNIFSNGTYNASSDNADGYSSVTVSVSPNVGTKEISANGTYNASSDSLDGYSQVVVNVQPTGNDYIDIFDESTTISFSASNGCTVRGSFVDDKVGTVVGSETSNGYEGFNIALKNLESGKTYKLNFNFSFIDSEFFSAYKTGYDIFATNRSDYDNYSSAWTNLLTRDNSSHNYQKQFSATATTMYLSFNVCGLADYGTNFFIISNMFVQEVANS